MSQQNFVSSPIATGGGGIFFEQHADALFLATLLVRGIPPILTDCRVEEVHLQTEHLGWNTDDLLLIGTRGASGHRQLAAQVKRRFTISNKNDDCKEAFSDFWRDFESNDRFDPERDRLALVTLRGTDTLLNAFNSLLDCARASADGADFARRLATHGYLSKPAQEHAVAIRTIIEETKGEAPSDDDFWTFLKVVCVVSFDLGTPTAQTEAWIKTLLAQTTLEPDPIAAAEATWRELLELVGSGMQTAASYRHSDLPESARSRHAAVAADDGVALHALVDHSETTLNGIHTSIGGLATISRDSLVTRVLEFLDESQVLVVTGPAGSGKSALVKSAIELLRSDRFCLTFRAEEFAVSHIDEMLQRAQASINARRLLALLSGQGSKVVHVESVERLLEASTRDAFADLLRLAREDRSIQLVLTCRDYSVDTVRTSLLEQVALPHRILDVPPLTDDELAQAVQAIPSLAPAIANARLKELLRSPYLLDKAANMDWSSALGLPFDERAFRARCWGEVVRREAVARGGLPRRRERVFLELAFRRARELRPYVRCDDLDAEALEELRKDDLVVVSKETATLAAPAHDVLEDWAIIQWLAGRFSLAEAEAPALADDVGGYPALRRGYRKWLGEMLECEAERAGAFVLASLGEESVPGYFRDDTLVCALLSPSAQEFLSRQTEALLAENGRLLVRVIHLLRVACKTTPSWLPESAAVPSLWLVPNGNAWVAVLKIVSDELDRWLPANLGLVLGLVEDWARSIAWDRPDPAGFREAGKIAFGLLVHLEGYRMDDLRKRTLNVIAKIPRANAAAFEDLLERECAFDRQDSPASELAEILLGWSGAFACRDFPEKMVRLATARFCFSNEDLAGSPGYDSSIGTERYFGIRDHTSLDFFPASAIGGPFHSLLRSHPDIGVQFIIDLLNHACTSYAEWRLQFYDPLEPAWRLKLDVPGESQITQWANSRLWCLYRGTSVGPYVVQTALMALESWLLSICKSSDVDVEAWLMRLLRESNNVAVTAVVASACNAYPDKAGRAALALLGSRDLIGMDRARMVHDLQHTDLSDLFPFSDPEQEIYEEERKKSNSLPHRQHDLEALAVKLQLTGQRDQVFEILDRHREALPPVEQQSEEDHLWRLALHRMDVRGFQLIEPQPGSEVSETAPEADSGEPIGVYLGPGELERDVQELVDRHAPVWARHQAVLALLNWGISAWRGESASRSVVSAWQGRLAEAKEWDHDPAEAGDFNRSGPGFVAAVCVRDRWDELSAEDREWCIAKLIHELERDCDTDDDSIRHARALLHADRPAAFALPLVLSKGNPADADARIVIAIAKALTHCVSDVVAYAAEGVGHYLQGVWLDFALRCVGAIAQQAQRLEELQAVEDRKPYRDRLHPGDLVKMVIPEVRKCIAEGTLDVDGELARLRIGGRYGRADVRTILQILGYCPDVMSAQHFHARVARALVDIWNDNRRNRGEQAARDYHFENDCLKRIAHSVLRMQVSDALTLCEPLLAAVDDHPRDIKTFVQELIVKEDISEGETSFWDIWQAFADRLCKAPWIENLNSRHSRGTELLNAIFFGLPWKENARHWRRLEGQANRIDTLVERLPIVPVVLKAYCRFLHDIGESLLPSSFVLVAERLSAGNATELLGGDSTAFYLEILLRRYVFGEPLRLKSNPSVRTAVLRILDELVEAGSSAAYRMRDDFVTPMVPHKT